MAKERKKPRRRNRRARAERPSTPGLHRNLVDGALEFTVLASDEPTVVRVSKIPLATNKLAVQASKPVEFEK
jgi:hypothetical protein